MTHNPPPEGARWDIPDWSPVQEADSDKHKSYLDQLDELQDLRRQLADMKNRPPEQPAQPEQKDNFETRSAAIKSLIIKLDTIARRNPPAILDDEDINGRFDAIEAFLKKYGLLNIGTQRSYNSPFLTLGQAARSDLEINLAELEVARTHFLRWHGSMAKNLPPPPKTEPSGIINRMIELYHYPRKEDPEIAHIKAYLGTEYIKFNPQGVASETDKNSFKTIALKKLPFEMRVLKYCLELWVIALIGMLIGGLIRLFI
ncbi:hypothetical protein SAMN05216403_14011 [Nitrosospira multiformis ATCC 25196]|uniref:Uncharacterized protein n=1 Tax=Nitrosospira multiformis (strain ATCC 25196 / NCIMB 11849 / C 71) TaxID=323848 RepID=Q2Y573_NITMU|nr:hypothetical protein [Nitrosospira multiformis]ABB76098.1 hypothetical protein NmulC_2794 [Nitrosospira multiformis ATCC 25196]SEG16674.1 hypothetical protein SAMN05216403_14011 [Nitrosospira multiformis ATCC 25196]